MLPNNRVLTLRSSLAEVEHIDLPATLVDATVNPMAPIVINTVTLRAAQVVLRDASLQLRAPLSIA